MGTPSGIALASDEVTWLPPLARPRCLDMHRRKLQDHIAEMGATIPKFPYSFLRPPASLSAHREQSSCPRRKNDRLGSRTRCRHRQARQQRERASSDGLCRSLHGGERSVGTRLDRGCAVHGHRLGHAERLGQVPADGSAHYAREVRARSAEPRDTVRGQWRRQAGLQYVSDGLRGSADHRAPFAVHDLEPGDIIATGTPSGVGFGRKPRESLKSGDIVRVTVEGLGVLENRMQ